MLVVICGDYGRLWHLFELQKNNKRKCEVRYSSKQRHQYSVFSVGSKVISGTSFNSCCYLPTPPSKDRILRISTVLLYLFLGGVTRKK